MYRRICDKCKKDIQNDAYWEVSRIHYGKKCNIDTNLLDWHLCEECYRGIQNYIMLDLPFDR